MTSAPQEAMNARSRFLSVFPGTEVGIVAGPASRNTDSYHCGSDELPASAYYSKTESRRDNRVDIYAAAIDFGSFNRDGKNLRSFSLWLVGHCQAGTPFTKNIREVIYSPDGVTVKRWDRLGIRSGGDLSHLTHTHTSWFRDSHCGGALAMVEAYINGDDEMNLDDKIGGDTGHAGRTVRDVFQDLSRLRNWLVGVYGSAPFPPAEDSTLRNLEKVRFIDKNLTKVEAEIVEANAKIDALTSQVSEILALLKDSPR